jgi:hypothetical protein
MTDPRDDLSRSVCIVSVTSSLIVAIFYTMVRSFLLVVGIYQRAFFLWRSKDSSKIPRRWRRIWKLASEVILPLLCVLIAITSLRGFLYDSTNWIIVSIFLHVFALIFDTVMFKDRHFEQGSVVASLIYSLAAFHTILSLIILICNSIHVYYLYKAKHAIIYDEDKIPDYGRID